jgi:hypothetical protein
MTVGLKHLKSCDYLPAECQQVQVICDRISRVYSSELEECDLKKILDRLSSFTFQKWMSKFTFQKHLRNDIRKSKRLKPYVHIQDNAFGNSDAIASGKTCEESGSREKSPKSRIKADLCPFSSSISVILSIFFFQTSDRLINVLTKL